MRTEGTGEEALGLLADTSVREEHAPSPARRLDAGDVEERSSPEAPRARPDVPVIYLTGYADETSDGDEVLQKPVSRERLVSAVDAALAERRASAGDWA